LTRRRGLVLAAVTAAAGAIVVATIRARSPRRRAHPVLQGGPLLIAHRGGAGLAPENTMTAFLQASADWHSDMIELDVQASADGRCMVIHDPSVDRTTDGTGAVADMTAAELGELDAGYRFTRDGTTYPFRGRGVRIPTIEDVLDALPDMRLTVEIKDGRAQRPLLDAIRRFQATPRVIVAGMYARDRRLFDDYEGAISASSEMLRAAIIAHRMRLDGFLRVKFDVAQMPEWHEGRRLLDPGLVRALHRRGIPVHVWTVNDPADMERLLDWGVDGLLTDRPDLAEQVLHHRFNRPLAPGHARASD
jgi:glycerophosphoryl diester phosphodiesterase